MKLSLARKIQLAFLVAFLILIGLGFLSYQSSNSLKTAVSWENHTQDVLLKLDDILSFTIDIETAKRGYIITGNQKFLKSYEQSIQKTEESLKQLQNILPTQKPQLEQLEKEIKAKIAFANRLVELRRNGQIEASRNLIESGEGEQIMNDIRLLVKNMKAEEIKLLRSREDDVNSSVANTLSLLFLGISIGVISLGLANFAIGREIKKRFAAEEDLLEANRDLEKRVEKRTEEIQQKNHELEEEIRQREEAETFRHLALEAGSLGTWMFDPVSDRVEMDERGLSLFGLSNGDFDGSRNSILKHIYEEDFSLLEELFQKTLDDKSDLSTEFRVVMPDGRVRWNHCTGKVQLDKDGNITQIIGNCRDITESKESEIKLRRSEQNVRNIIDNLFAFVGVLSPEGILLEANRTALDAAAVREEEVIGKDFAETYWWAHSKEVQEQLRESIKKVASGEKVRYDVDVRVGGGKIIPIDFMMAPLYDEDGNIVNLIPSGLDLTPRKDAEDALRRSEDFANSILDSLTAHVAVVDKDGNITATNIAWNKFAENNTNKLQIPSTGVGQNYLSVCDNASGEENSASHVSRNLRSILNGEKQIFTHEYPCHSPTEKRWFLLQISPMIGGDGGAVISHINITDRKLSEIRLKNSEEFNRSIVENSPDCIKVLELDGTLSSMNKNGLDLMEIDDFSTVEKTQWIDLWKDAENELAYQAVQSAAKGKTAGFEGFCKTAKGNGKWWDVSVAPVFGANGDPVRLIATSRDITERHKFEQAIHRSKEQLEFVLDVAKLGTWNLNLETGTADRSARHDQIFGYKDSMGDWTYEKFLEHVLPEHRKEVEAKIQKAIKKGKDLNFETQIRRTDGKVRWIWVRGKVQEEDDDSKMLGTVLDITKRKNAESEREKLLTNEKTARRDAEIATRLRDEFLATVSHELRAPLNSILGWAKMLEKGTLDEKSTDKAIDTIVRNAESQNRLIEDLLDVSRIISGKLRLEVRTVNPISIVESAMETIRPAAEAKGIKLEIKGEDIISHISGDPNRLQQVIWNLLSNAIKFTPNDGRVTLEIERDGDFVELSVIDTGVGIKEEFLPHVFDRFRQADNSSIRKFGGLGLGLAIVRHITEMHGGTVHVDSEGEDKGSTFSVRLPLVIPTDNEDAAVRPSAEQIGLERDPKLSLDGLLILVVDDEDDTRQLLKQALTFYGATVTTADSAANALSEVEDKNPDAIVSDIGMPEEDGYSFIRKVRNLSNERQRQTPAIALTAFTRAQDRMRALSSGFQNHVSKPVEPDELVTVIASIMGRLHAEEEE